MERRSFVKMIGAAGVAAVAAPAVISALAMPTEIHIAGARPGGRAARLPRDTLA